MTYEELETIRARLRLSRALFADDLGITVSTYWSYKTNRPVSAATARAALIFDKRHERRRE